MNRTYILKRENIYSYLEKHPLNSSEFALKMGVHRNTLQRWMSGRTRFIKESNVRKIANSLGCEVNDIAKLRHDSNYGKSLPFDPIEVLCDQTWFWQLLEQGSHARLISLLYLLRQVPNLNDLTCLINLYFAEAYLNQGDFELCRYYLGMCERLNQKNRDQIARDKMSCSIQVIRMLINLHRKRFKMVDVDIRDMNQDFHHHESYRISLIQRALDHWKYNHPFPQETICDDPKGRVTYRQVKGIVQNYLC